MQVEEQGTRKVDTIYPAGSIIKLESADAHGQGFKLEPLSEEEELKLDAEEKRKELAKKKKESSKDDNKKNHKEEVDAEKEKKKNKAKDKLKKSKKKVD